jgi:mannose/fructose/N-acetylgalactosamine-specific phosphotransferase system component IIB
MSVVLFRIDERLIHGQVVVGWGARLHPQRIAVVDDEIAASAWEQDLYSLGLPDDVMTEFVTVTQARERMDDWQQATERMFVLTRDVATMLRLARDGRLRGAEVNIGGIHHSAERREVLPYVYLSIAEAAALRRLAAEGVDVSARDLPAAPRVPLSQLLSGGAAA